MTKLLKQTLTGNGFSVCHISMPRGNEYVYGFINKSYFPKDSKILGVPKNLAESGEQQIVGSPFNFVFARVSDKTQNKCNKDSFIQIYN